MVLHGLGEGAEDDAELGELFFEGCRHRDAVEDRVDCDAGQALPLGERNAKLLEGLQELGVDLVEARGPLALPLRGRVVDDLLVVDGRVGDVGPLRLPGPALQLAPVAIRAQAPLEHELGLALLGRDQPDDVLVQARRQRVGFDVAHEPPLVVAGCERLECLRRCAHQNLHLKGYTRLYIRSNWSPIRSSLARKAAASAGNRERNHRVARAGRRFAPIVSGPRALRSWDSKLGEGWLEWVRCRRWK